MDKYLEENLRVLLHLQNPYPLTLHLIFTSGAEEALGDHSNILVRIYLN